MGQKQRFYSSRIAMFVCVLALHILLFAPVLHLRSWQSSVAAPESAFEIFWLEPPTPLAPEKIPSRTQTRQKAPSTRSHAADESTAITPEPITAPPRIDWNARAGDAADAYVRQQEEEARQRAKFAPRQPFARLESKEKLDQGWHEYRFKRVESHPGGTVIHLNERCVVAFAPFPIPACAIGKIKPGDEMYEAFQEWKRERDKWESRH